MILFYVCSSCGLNYTDPKMKKTRGGGEEEEMDDDA